LAHEAVTPVGVFAIAGCGLWILRRRDGESAGRLCELSWTSSDALLICIGMNPRLTVTLTEPQLTWLEREAKRLGLSLGELLRRIIDTTRGSK
jgi:hypothetical protein